jgi:flavin reductase ActVB
MQTFPGTDAEAFLALARSWAATVTVVTVVRPPAEVSAGHPLRDGFTATAFLTVSLRPPLILISASKETSAAGMMRSSAHFVVNLLSVDQVAVAAHFALPHTEREDLWSQLRWQADDSDVPLLTESLGAFSAERVQEVDCGDHVVVLGAVKAIHRFRQGEPLLYTNRAYARAQTL